METNPFPQFAPSECARCKTLHICTGNPNCPCYGLDVSENVLDYIASTYDQCVCNSCLETLNQKLG